MLCSMYVSVCVSVCNSLWLCVPPKTSQAGLQCGEEGEDLTCWELSPPGLTGRPGRTGQASFCSPEPSLPGARCTRWPRSLRRKDRHPRGSSEPGQQLRGHPERRRSGQICSQRWEQRQQPRAGGEDVSHDIRCRYEGGGHYQYGGQGEGKDYVDDKLSDVLVRSLEC